MKKILVLIILVIGITFFQFNKNSLDEAKKAIDGEDYKTFYSLVKDDFYEGKEKAVDLLMNNFFVAIQNGDIEQVKFYLSKDRSIIDKEFEGYRAIGASLFVEKENIQMMKLLLSYNPNLNYMIPSFKYMTPIQMIATNTTLNNNAYLAKLFIDSGANVNFKSEDGDGSTSALMYSYISDNYTVFKIFIENGADLKLFNKNNRDIIYYIKGSYLTELVKYISKPNISYKKKISKDIFKITIKDTYKIIHSKNLQYLEEIFKRNSLKNLNKDSIFDLAKYYALTNEITGLELLIKEGLCSNDNFCSKLNQIAILNNNIAIINILKKGK